MGWVKEGLVSIIKALTILLTIFAIFSVREIPIETVGEKDIIQIVPNKHLYIDSDEEQTLRNKRYIDFVRLMYRFAQYREHPFPEAVAVQAGYESRYGASEVARNANNLFGIKARKNREGGYISETYKAITKEENKDGYEEYLYQDFEVYKNIEANWNGYIRVINQERYIRNGIKQATSNKEYITSLKKGGYATEDDYILHIMSIIERYKKLNIFD